MTIRDYEKLVQSVHCCAENQCEICPRGDTPVGCIECKTKLADDTTVAIKELLSELKHVRMMLKINPDWISTEKQLPKKERAKYLCVLDTGAIVTAYWTNTFAGIEHDAFWQFWPPQYTTVKYWMPLPTPPKEGDK